MVSRELVRVDRVDADPDLFNSANLASAAELKLKQDPTAQFKTTFMARSAETLAPFTIAQSNLPHLYTEFILPFVGKLSVPCFIELDFSGRWPRMKHSDGRDKQVSSS